MPAPNISSAGRLAEAVLTQARDEAEKIRQAAATEASRLIAEAEAEAAERNEADAKARDADARRAQVAALALARLEAQRQVLEAREAALERVFARAVELLESLRTRDQYARVLSRLVREGVDALGGDSFIVEVAPEDLPAAAEMAASLPAATELRAHAGLRGGAIVSRRDRRASCDNTFGAVLSRNQPRLRAAVAEWLWGDAARAIGESEGATKE